MKFTESNDVFGQYKIWTKTLGFIPSLDPYVYTVSPGRNGTTIVTMSHVEEDSKYAGDGSFSCLQNHC